jgi:hypothetical protein
MTRFTTEMIVGEFGELSSRMDKIQLSGLFEYSV